MSSSNPYGVDVSTLNLPPESYDVNNRRGFLHPDLPGLRWRKRAHDVVWELLATKGGEDRSTTFPGVQTWQEAVVRYREHRPQLEAGEVVVAKGDARLDDAWALYAKEMDAWVAAGNFSDKTRVSYSGSYRIHVQPVLGRSYLARLSRQDMIDFFSDLKESGLADWTRVSIKNVLKLVLDKAVAEEWILSNPLTQVDQKYLPKQQPSAEYKPRLLRNEELLALFAASPDLYRLPVIVLAFTGMRLRELCGLLWQDVDLLNGEIRVARQLSYDRFTKQWGTEDPKGRRGSNHSLSKRTIGLQPAALEALEKQLRVERDKGFGWDADFVFTTSAASGLPLAPDNLRSRGVQAAATKAGLGHLRAHDLRHTTASILAAAGVNDHVAAQFMGHTKETYERIYAKAFRDAEERKQTLGLLSAIGFGVASESDSTS